MSAVRQALFRLDVRRPDHLGPFHAFIRYEFSELGGRTCEDGLTKIGNGLLDFGISQARIDRLVERIDDWRGRILGGDNAHPAERFIAGYKLGNGRHIWQRWYAYWRTKRFARRFGSGKMPARYGEGRAA